MSLDAIYDAIIDGKAKVVAAEVQAALDEGVSADEILHDACIPAMDEVGSMFENGTKFVPEMLISARAMQTAVDILQPHLVDAETRVLGRVVLGTVAGDLHDIGKNLVGMMLEGAGFKVIDLGTDVAPEQFVEAVKENKPDIIGMSALLTTTMPAIKQVVEGLEAAGVRGQVKIIIGGAPITQEFADAIGADAYARDAGSAPRIAKELMGIEG